MYLPLQDPSEPDKIGMEGVVRFLEDLCLVRRPPRLQKNPSHFTFLVYVLREFSSYSFTNHRNISPRVSLPAPGPHLPIGADHRLEVQGPDPVRVQQGGVRGRHERARL